MNVCFIGGSWTLFRISEVTGHADEDMVLHGRVRGVDKLGNDAADEAADSGRRRVSPAVIDARRKNRNREKYSEKYFLKKFKKRKKFKKIKKFKKMTSGKTAQNVRCLVRQWIHVCVSSRGFVGQGC